MDKSKVYKAGYIARTHGLKGGVAVNLLPGDLPAQITSCWLDSAEGLEAFEVEDFSARPDLAFIKLSGIDTIEAARALRGRSLFLKKSARPKAPKGTFHDDEVTGFRVEDKSAGEIGTISSVSRQAGRGFLMVKQGRREIIIPLDGPFITAILPTLKTVQVDLPDGFLDI